MSDKQTQDNDKVLSEIKKAFENGKVSKVMSFNPSLMDGPDGDPVLNDGSVKCIWITIDKRQQK